MTSPLAVQQSISSVMPIGVAGQWADLQSEEFGKTFPAVNTDTLSVVFGTLLQYDTTNLGPPPGALRPTVDTDLYVGIVLFERMYDFPTERDDYGPLPGLPVELAWQGNVLVYSETAVTAYSGAVRVRITTENRASNQFLGGFSQGSASTATMKFDPSAFMWMNTLAGAGIVPLRVNLPPGTFTAAVTDT
jgi:hypothetical protein